MIGTRVRIRCDAFPGALNRVGTVTGQVQDLGGHRGLSGVRVALDATPMWVAHEHEFMVSDVELVS